MTCLIGKREFDFCFHSAGLNWAALQSDYEQDDLTKIQLLNDRQAFDRFLKGYGLARHSLNEKNESESRNKKYATRDEWFNYISKIIPLIISGSRYDSIDDAAISAEAPYKLSISCLSKVCAIVAPDRFVAYDKFASKGLAAWDGKPKASTYSDYMLRIFDCWSSNVGSFIRDEMSRRPLPLSRGLPDTAFGFRVLDNYLMLRGGRWVLH